jgi:hypothetical protein
LLLSHGAVYEFAGDDIVVDLFVMPAIPHQRPMALTIGPYPDVKLALAQWQSNSRCSRRAAPMSYQHRLVAGRHESLIRRSRLSGSASGSDWPVGG